MSDGETLIRSTTHATRSVSSPHPGFRTDATCKVGYNLNDNNFTTDKHDYLHSFNCASNYTDSVDQHAPLKNCRATSQNQCSFSDTQNGAKGQVKPVTSSQAAERQIENCNGNGMT